MTEPTSLLVAAVKNEGPYILEWVAHHRLCGFSRIQIYQNDSNDMTVQILRTLERIGAIEFHNNRHNKGAHQMRAYRRASRSEATRSCSRGRRPSSICAMRGCSGPRSSAWT